MDNKVKHVMVDIETTGKRPGCNILSIGACTFNEAEGEARLFFSCEATQDFSRFTTDPDTMEWWAKQTPYVRELAFGGTNPIEYMLGSFEAFLGSCGSFKIWGNSARFDLEILMRAYEICNMPVPWKFWDEMCYRTLKNLYPNIPYRKPRNAHSALEDAEAQAAHAEEILRYKRTIECNPVYIPGL